jgi:putative ABC transport system permease protein
MTFRQFAAKNVRGNWRQYIAYFLSSTFTVMIFFIYASFILHPDVVNGQIRGGMVARQGLIGAEYVIAVFSFFFVLYSNFAFIKSRKKEFGLLTLFGMTRQQIRKLVYYENTFIAILAILTGTALGLLFTKLFLMIIAQLLYVENPIRFMIVPSAVWLTWGGFFGLFQVITLFTLLQIRSQQVIELLKAAKKPKSLPFFSKWLVAVAVVFIGTGYILAYTSNMMTVVLLMLPVIFLVTVGTYFLFTQGSVAIFRRLQNKPSLYYQGTRLITISQLVFKMKDNARVLFIASILSAVVLTASGTFYIFDQGLREQIMDYNPQTIGFIEKGADAHQVIHPDKLKAILQEDGVGIDYEVKLDGVTASVKTDAKQSINVLLVANSDFNRIAEKVKKVKPLTVQHGQAAFVTPFEGAYGERFAKGKQLTTSVGDTSVTFQIEGAYTGAIVDTLYEAERILVINDEDYRTLAADVPEQGRTTVYGFELKHWESTQGTIEKIEKLIPDNEKAYFISRVEPYMTAKQLTALTLFVGLFVSILFFIASGSMIYFKLFTELQEDKAQFKALSRIGMTEKEIKKVTSVQLGLIFFIPFLVGVVHASFALKALGNLLSASVWQYGIVVIGLFLLMQTIYFFLTKSMYTRAIFND